MTPALAPLAKLDRRWIFLVIGLLVFVPLMWPIGLPIEPTRPSRMFAAAVDSVPDGSYVLLACDYDPSGRPELVPMTKTALRHLFRKRCKVVITILWVGGPGLVERTLEDVAASIEAVGRALGAGEAGRRRAASFRRELDEVRAATAGLPRPRVFLAEWVEPPYAPGHWLPELVAIAGGECLLGRPGEESVQVTWEAVREARPELVVLAPCGYDAPRAAREPVPDGLECRVAAVDGSAYYARPAPRLAAGARQLAHLLHPDAVRDPGLPVFDVTPAGALP